MSNEQINFQDVLQLVELIKASSNFSEIKLRFGDVEVELRRSGGSALLTPAPMAASPAPKPPSSSGEAAAAREMATPSLESVAESSRTAQASQVPHPAATDKVRKASLEGMTIIKSPMVGTVYLAPEPGAPAFVKVGQAVSPGDPVCIVEVMKLMNSIDAGCHGIITEILAGDGEAVEYGQQLFIISPH